MKKNQHSNILKKFRSGNFSEAINLYHKELIKEALNESVHQSLDLAKKHLEEIEGADASKKTFLEMISELQSFFDITYSEKFRESTGEKCIESPVSGIKETADGDIVLSDDFNHRIQIYDKNFNLKHCFGQKGNNTGEFHYPKGLDIDVEGNIYVADCWNHRIQKFDRDGKFISTFGSYGSEPAQFHEPVSVAINNEKLLVVDRCNHRIQFFDTNGDYQGHIGHRGRTIEENLAELFETPPEKFSIPSLEFPSDIALDSKNDIFIVDSHNHRILKLDLNGHVKLCFGKQGTDQGNFLYPQSIAIDSFDNIFISDLNNHRVQLFSPVGEHYFSFSSNGKNEPLDSPTILTCGKNNSLFVGSAFNPKVIKFFYGQHSQKERYKIKEKFNENSTHSLYLSGSFFNREQDREMAIKKYVKALTLDSNNTENTILNLPIDYLLSDQKIQKEDIPTNLLNYYDKELSSLNNSILEVYQKRKEVTERLINPILKAEKNIIEEKLTSGEIDKELYELSKTERHLYRESRELFLRLKRTQCFHLKMLLKILPQMLSKQDNNGVKILIQKILSNFYQLLDFFNILLSDHDSQNLKCFEEVQKGTENSFSLRDFRLAYGLTELTDDFIKLAFPILKSSIHILSQFALKTSTSKSDSIIEFYTSLTGEKNLKKLGSALFKLRYDFATMLQYKESLRVLFSYLALNSDEIVSNILSHRSCDKAPLLDKDKFNYEKDLIELLFMEEINIDEKENGIQIGLYCFSDSDLDSFQKVANQDGKEKYTDLINDLQKAIDQLLSDKKKLDLLILKHEANLKSIHPGDQKSKLQITNEYNLAKTQSAFGNKLILEHLSLLKIIHFKRCLYFQLNWELKKRAKDEKSAKEISCKMDNHYNDVYETYIGIKNNRKKISDDLVIWENNFKNAFKRPSDIDREKEIDINSKLFQLTKDIDLIDILRNEYSSLVNIQGEFKRHLIQKDQGEIRLTNGSNIIKFNHDLQFGSLGDSDGQFNLPHFLCINLNGDIFVADPLNHRIQKFDLNGNYILSFGSSGDLDGFFNKPEGIVCDDDNNLLCCDLLNHRIQKFDSSGKHLSSWGTFGDRVGCFNNPYSICRDNKGFLYITDVGNHRIQKFTPEGQFVLSFKTQGENNGESFQYEVICNHNDTILVGDFSSDRIQLFDTNGKFIKSLNYSKETDANLHGTSNISYDNKGRIYISEFRSNAISVFSEEFRLITTIGSSDNLKILFNAPCNAAFTDKYMFLCDHRNHRIHRFSN